MSFSGKSVNRQPTDISLVHKGKTSVVRALVSVSPFSFDGKMYSLLVIENISELAGLRALLPICSSCKKIRNEKGEWDKIETYLRRQLPETDFSHGLCPGCAKKMYPKFSD
ncbi:MAG: hypothetical protein HY952_02950 [Elusimicrobia bacterium]|nr:hypothetical protein [Elusimicrobiota bacterium]